MGEIRYNRILWDITAIAGFYFLFSSLDTEKDPDDYIHEDKEDRQWGGDKDIYWGVLSPVVRKRKAKELYDVLNNNVVLFPWDLKELDQILLEIPTIHDYIAIEEMYGTDGAWYEKDRTLTQWLSKAYREVGDLDEIKKKVYDKWQYTLPI